MNEENQEFVGQFGALERITFVSDLLKKQIEIRNMLDLRTNIMIGFNSALIVFFATSFNSDWARGIFFITAMLTVGLSFLFAVFALKPSHLITKKGQEESLFYHHKICSKEIEDYRQEIMDTIKDEAKVYANYALEIYNLTKYSNVPRKFYLNWSIRILFYGVIVSILLYGASALWAMMIG